MTKPDVLAPGFSREDVADLDLLAGDHDPVDQQLDQLASLVEGRVPEAGRDPVAERLERGHQPEQIADAISLPREPRLLLRQGRPPPLDLGAATPVLRQGDDPAEIGVRQAAELLIRAGPP